MNCVFEKLLMLRSSLFSAVLWTGEVWEFLSFAERHPGIFYNIFLFGVTSALGQVGGSMRVLIISNAILKNRKHPVVFYNRYLVMTDILTDRLKCSFFRPSSS